jgi:hypothetical protein
MPDASVPVECPLCCALMRVPRGGRQVTITCHNGHVFVHTFERKSTRWLTTAQFVTLVICLLLLFALVFAHQWNGRRMGSTTSAVAGDRAPVR